MDNVFIKRLWRSVKYECVFLHDWAVATRFGSVCVAKTPPHFLRYHPLMQKRGDKRKKGVRSITYPLGVIWLGDQDSNLG